MAFLRDINCSTCQALLADYIRSQLTNQRDDITDPAVAFHLETCPTCQAAYFREFRTQGLAKSLPALQQVGRRAGAVRALEQILQPTSTTLWQRMNEKLQRLTVEVVVLVDQARAVFGNLPAPLTPQPAPAGILRLQASADQETPEPRIEIVKLHPPEADLEIALSVVSVTDAQSTLAVWLKTLSTGQPLDEERITLRTDQGSLLEMVATDAQGLAFFRGLALARYLLQVAHAGQTWEFVVPLTEWRSITET